MERNRNDHASGIYNEDMDAKVALEMGKVNSGVNAIILRYPVKFEKED